jgi:type II secretory pathway component PulF
VIYSNTEELVKGLVKVRAHTKQGTNLDHLIIHVIELAERTVRLEATLDRLLKHFDCEEG